MRIVAFLFILSVFGGLMSMHNFVWAQNYTSQSTSVTSTSVPINVLPAAQKKEWCIRPRSTAANPVLCFAYQGAIPTAVPTASAVQELSAGIFLCDSLVPVGNNIDEAWACVLATGATAVTVDATWR